MVLPINSGSDSSHRPVKADNEIRAIVTRCINSDVVLESIRCAAVGYDKSSHIGATSCSTFYHYGLLPYAVNALGNQNTESSEYQQRDLSDIPNVKVLFQPQEFPSPQFDEQEHYSLSPAPSKDYISCGNEHSYHRDDYYNQTDVKYSQL
jgi:hypothetical protein